MTSSVPDSFSMDELSNMLENAPIEEEIHAEQADDSNGEFTPEQIEDIAQEALEFASNKCKDPLVHKVMCMMIVSRMVEWHNNCAKRQLTEGEIESAACWFRDAGKFQSMMDSLTNIGIGPDDFTCSHE